MALLGVEGGDDGLTSTGQVMGTIDYMAPEQFENTHGVDIRADIYSLGATLYKLLTGHAPFSSEKYGSSLEKIAALARDDVPSVSTHRDDLPTDLVTAVDRMLSRDPTDRYATPVEVANALAPFAEGADLVRLWKRAQSAPDADPGAPFNRKPEACASVVAQHLDAHASGLRLNEQPHTRKRPRRTKVIVGGAALLLAIGVLAAWAANHFLRQQAPDVSTATGPQTGSVKTQTPIGLTFQQTEQPFCSGRTVGVAFADLDDDGDQDVVVASYGNVPDQVWLNDGLGQFAPGMNLGDGRSTNVAIADLNGDGKLDAFFTSRHVANSVWFGDGTGQFVRSDQILGKEICRSVALNDLDGDGDMDAVVAEGGAGVSGNNRLLFNNGSGVLVESDQRLGSRPSWSVAVGDLDGDGDPDLMFGNGDYKSKPTGWQPNSVWLNDGQGQFEKLPQSFPESHCFKVLLGDLDRDGDLDAAFSGFEDQCSIWFNDGTGKFIDSDERSPVGEWCSGGMEDLDQDQDLDIVFAAKNGAIQILLNDGSGRFPERIDLQSEPGIETGFALADMDGDDDVDIFVGYAEKKDSIWFNQLVPSRTGASLDSGSDAQSGPPMVTSPNDWQIGKPVNLMQPDRLDPTDFGLTVHEEGWTLTQILRPPERIRAAGFHPVSGQLHFGNQKDQERWFHCVAPNGAARVVYRTAGTSFAFSPDGRQLLVTNGVENNLIAQIDTATGEVVRQMDPKPNQDDDPAGIAFAPSGWTGSVVTQEQALCIDMGYAGPRGLWRVSLDGSAPEQIAKNPDDLSSPIDLTFTTSEVYVINRVERGGMVDPIRPGDYNERIYRFEDGTFVPIRTDGPIVDASGIAFDPATSDLLILCGQTSKDPIAKKVLRLHRSAQEDVYRVTDVFSGLKEPCECGVDISPDGGRIAITDCGARAIYVFSRSEDVETTD